METEDPPDARHDVSTVDENQAKKLASLRLLPLPELKQELYRILMQQPDPPLFTLRDSTNTKAKCWKQFRHLYEKKKGVEFIAHQNGFVSCNNCSRVFAYQSSHGNKTLNEHLKKCSRSSVARGGFEQFLSKQTISDADKKRITKAAARMCATDMRAFNIVAGDGFKALIAAVFELGVRLKRPCDVSELLPVPNTLRNNVRDDATVIRGELLKICELLFGDCCGAGFTVDLWTDSIRKRSYMSLTMHYLTQAFKLYARTLQVKDVEGLSHTAEFLLGVFNEALFDFGIRNSSLCTVVSDCGSNLCGSGGIPSVYNWIPCADHKIATMITTVLSKTTSAKGRVHSSPFYRYFDAAPEVFQLMDRCKDLVKYFKKSKLQNQLETTLKQENTTRWNSQLSLLESVLISFDAVTELLAARGKLVYIHCIDKPLLEELVRFLQPFKEATLKLEKWKQPTLHLVVHERYNLITHLSPKQNSVMIDKVQGKILDGPLQIDDPGNVQVIPADSNNIIAIKQLMMQHSAPKWSLHLYHLIAALLDPRQKRRLLKFGVAATDIKKAEKHLIELMKRAPDTSGPALQLTAQRSSRKKHKTLTGSIIVGAADLCSSDESEDEAESCGYIDEHDELSLYLKNTLKKEEKVDFDLLQWWNDAGKLAYPKLGHVARSVLCIPAASAMSESNFSSAGTVLCKTRNALNPSMLNDLLTVRSNADLI